jgi:hypothetical protein
MLDSEAEVLGSNPVPMFMHNPYPTPNVFNTFTTSVSSKSGVLNLFLFYYNFSTRVIDGKGRAHTAFSNPVYLSLSAKWNTIKLKRKIGQNYVFFLYIELNMSLYTRV